MHKPAGGMHLSYPLRFRRRRGAPVVGQLECAGEEQRARQRNRDGDEAHQEGVERRVVVREGVAHVLGEAVRIPRLHRHGGKLRRQVRAQALEAAAGARGRAHAGVGRVQQRAHICATIDRLGIVPVLHGRRRVSDCARRTVRRRVARRSSKSHARPQRTSRCSPAAAGEARRGVSTRSSGTAARRAEGAHLRGDNSDQHDELWWWWKTCGQARTQQHAQCRCSQAQRRHKRARTPQPAA